MDETLIPLFSTREKRHASFTGDGSEYFRIWIVNLALTIATLGIYSAWAKVRRQQYFFRHTHLAGASFDYHGEPLAILKGRIIAFVLFALYLGSGLFGPLVTLGVMAAIAVVVPWLIVRSLRFQLRSTSYRGLRFQFRGRTPEAYAVFVGYGLLTLVTLGLAAPIAYRRFKQFQHGNAAYGRSSFSLDVSIGDVYRVFIAVWLGAIAVLVFVWMAVIGVAGVLALFGGAEAADDASPIAIAALAIFFVLIFVLYVTFAIGLRALFNVQMRNLLWNQTRLGDHQLGSDLDLREYIWIEITNIFLTICSLGLYRPFAQVRMAKYVVDSTWIETAGTLDEFQAADVEDANAIGDEIAGFFDFDVAF